VEGNPALAERLERALFDDHFEVVRVSGEDVPVSVFGNQFKVYEAMGLVVIYSSDPLAAEEKRKLSVIAGELLFDLSTLNLPAGESEGLRRILSTLRSVRSVP